MPSKVKLKTTVPYNQGQPVYTGVYAVRVPKDGSQSLHDDIFLLFDSSTKRWYQLYSDQGYRGEIVGWVGPLERTRG